MTKKIKFTVEMDVTIPQALALQAMFEYWTYLGNIGSSRHVSFMVDGDGNFHPKCKISTSEPIPQLTKELENICVISDDRFGMSYDFDLMASALRLQTVVEKPKTMDEMYGDKSNNHLVCEKCGRCITCGDCRVRGCGRNINA